MINAQSASQEKPCDPEAALLRLGDDPELYREVLQRFFEGSVATLDRISSAIQSGNGHDLHQAAHSYKGLAAMAGTDEVARLAATLDLMGKKGELGGASAVLLQLRDELDHARDELAPYYL